MYLVNQVQLVNNNEKAERKPSTHARVTKRKSATAQQVTCNKSFKCLKIKMLTETITPLIRHIEEKENVKCELE